MAPGEKLIAADEPEEHQDVVLKSFVCLEGEVVVQDEAVLVRRLEGEEDVSFGSLVCSAGEVQVSSLLMTELAAGTQNTPVCTAAASVSGQPLGRSYCVRASPREDPENTVNRSDQDQDDLSEGRGGVSSGEGEITFKGLCCSGGEMEIGDVSGMSVFMENLTEEQSVCCLYDVSADDARSSAAVTAGSTRDDHIYSRAEGTPRLRNTPSARQSLGELSEKSGNTVGHSASPPGNTKEKHYETEASDTAAEDRDLPQTPSSVRSVMRDHTAEIPARHLCPELPESPLLNSTSLANDDYACTPVPQDPAQKKDVGLKVASADHQQLKNAPQVLGDGPLQEQLRQMAEMLMVASGKVFARAPAAVEMRSACVWSSPVQQTERSTNTSAALEVSDACTSTDSLLWK